MTDPSAPYVPPPPPPAPPATGGGASSSNRGPMIVLSYLWILALVPLLVEKDDKEVQWHAKHGIVLLVAEVIIWVVLSVLSMVTGGVGGCVFFPLYAVLWIGIVVVHVICIAKGLGGGRFTIPGLSVYADRF